MRIQSLFAATILIAGTLLTSSCEKEEKPAQPPYDLDVILSSKGKQSGFVKFRQDPDPAKVITLDVSVRDLKPNNDYLLQRAVDVNIDGNCTGTDWLILGKGLTPQTIHTNNKGSGSAELWRDVSAIASGTWFDIHFRIVDASSMEVVLTSDCYQYQVR
jgi:hypothetical protein